MRTARLVQPNSYELFARPLPDGVINLEAVTDQTLLTRFVPDPLQLACSDATARVCPKDRSLKGGLHRIRIQRLGQLG